jgi:hypothetical protein
MIENTVRDHRTVSPVTGTDLVWAAVLGILTCLGFMIADSRVAHWCLVPLMACLVVVGADAIKWFRGGCDTFDPKGLLGVFGLNFFFLAPLLVVYYDPEIGLVNRPPDWRPWIGYMALLNLGGLLTYQVAQHFAFNRLTSPAKTIWLPAPNRQNWVPLCAVCIAFLGWLVVLVTMGGFRGLIEQHLYRERTWGGLGFFRMFMKAGMILCLIALTFRRRSRHRISFLLVACMLLLFLVGQIAFGEFGTRRASMLYPLVWAVGIIHYYWRHLTSRHLLLAMIPVFLLVQVYTLYKVRGKEFLAALRGETTMTRVAEKAQANPFAVLIGAMSRADIQAWMVYKKVRFPGDYNPRHGRTYLDAPFFQIPHWLTPWYRYRASVKLRAGTAFMFGEGFYVPGRPWRRSLRIYGLAGEAILNFGFWAIPIAFGVLGLVVGYYRRKWLSWQWGDTRFFVAPFACVLALLALNSDSDNIATSLIFHFLVPVAVVRLSSVKLPCLGNTGDDTHHDYLAVENSVS